MANEPIRNYSFDHTKIRLAFSVALVVARFHTFESTLRSLSAMFDIPSKHHNFRNRLRLSSLFSSVSSSSYGYVCDSFALSYLQSIWQSRWSSAQRAARTVWPECSSIRSAAAWWCDAIGSFDFRGMLWTALGSVDRPMGSGPGRWRLSWPAFRWTQWWQRSAGCAFWWRPCPAASHRRTSRTAPGSGRMWCQPNRTVGLVSVGRIYNANDSIQ